ncbi:MAG: hypothetical protein N4A49_07375 [Marinifilaceae bacterium]|jgi:hypothetical protein|nr:hypothetical protein [Marinifilaceae bacterium]
MNDFDKISRILDFYSAQPNVKENQIARLEAYLLLVNSKYISAIQELEIESKNDLSEDAYFQYSSILLEYINALDTELKKIFPNYVFDFIPEDISLKSESSKSDMIKSLKSKLADNILIWNLESLADAADVGLKLKKFNTQFKLFIVNLIKCFNREATLLTEELIIQ